MWHSYLGLESVYLYTLASYWSEVLLPQIGMWHSCTLTSDWSVALLPRIGVWHTCTLASDWSVVLVHSCLWLKCGIRALLPWIKVWCSCSDQNVALIHSCLGLECGTHFLDWSVVLLPQMGMVLLPVKHMHFCSRSGCGLWHINPVYTYIY